MVAFLNRRDQYHDWAKAHWDRIVPPMLTCEAVLSEACFLLGASGRGSESLMQMIQRQIIAIPFRLEEHVRPVGKLLAKYRAVPMSLADACLVRMSELHPDSQVFTLDGDFNLYRRNGRQMIPTITPE